MAKLTLLEMVQSIMSDMDSDSVEAYDENEESLQVASILKDVYFQMVTNRIIPEHYALDQLTDAAAGSETFMQIPDDVAKVQWIKYNVIASGDTVPVWKTIKYCRPEEFTTRSLALDSTDTTNNDTVVDPGNTSVTLYVQRQAPTYWTTFDDEYICFDAYDSAVDTTGLVASKTIIYARKIPTWTASDSFTPDMDENLFPLLLAEAKSTAFVNLKQQANAKVEKQARDQKVFIQNDKHRTAASQKTTSYTSSSIAGRPRP